MARHILLNVSHVGRDLGLRQFKGALAYGMFNSQLRMNAKHVVANQQKITKMLSARSPLGRGCGGRLESVPVVAIAFAPCGATIDKTINRTERWRSGIISPSDATWKVSVENNRTGTDGDLCLPGS